MSIQVRSLVDGDFFSWLELYSSYGAFHNTPVTDENALRVWSWLTDRNQEQNGVVALDDENEGQIIGLAHFREFNRPLAASRGLFLDDLFVSPDAHEQGIDTVLIQYLKDLAHASGLTVVRWLASPDNKNEIKLYDSMATRTNWITYDLNPT